MKNTNDASQPKEPSLAERLQASGKFNFLPDDHPFYTRGTVIFFRPRRTPPGEGGAPGAEPAPAGPAPQEPVPRLAMGADALSARLSMPRLTAEEALAIDRNRGPRPPHHPPLRQRRRAGD